MLWMKHLEASLLKTTRRGASHLKTTRRDPSHLNDTQCDASYLKDNWCVAWPAGGVNTTSLQAFVHTLVTHWVRLHDIVVAHKDTLSTRCHLKC